jgi:hypothetical protein
VLLLEFLQTRLQVASSTVGDHDVGRRQATAQLGSGNVDEMVGEDACADPLGDGRFEEVRRAAARRTATPRTAVVATVGPGPLGRDRDYSLIVWRAV